MMIYNLKIWSDLADNSVFKSTIVVALIVVENTIPGTSSKFADDSKLCGAV